MTSRNKNLSGRRRHDHDPRSPRAIESAPHLYGLTRRDLLAASALGLLAGAPRLARAAEPEGQLTWAVHVSLAPTWFDPADTQALVTPFMVLYALHDGMVKAMPGTLQAPCLAESWQMSEDGTAWDFTIRTAPSSTMERR